MVNECEPEIPQSEIFNETFLSWLFPIIFSSHQFPDSVILQYGGCIFFIFNMLSFSGSLYINSMRRKFNCLVWIKQLFFLTIAAICFRFKLYKTYWRRLYVLWYLCLMVLPPASWKPEFPWKKNDMSWHPFLVRKDVGFRSWNNDRKTGVRLLSSPEEDENG